MSSFCRTSSSPSNTRQSIMLHCIPWQVRTACSTDILKQWIKILRSRCWHFPLASEMSYYKSGPLTSLATHLDLRSTGMPWRLGQQRKWVSRSRLKRLLISDNCLRPIINQHPTGVQHQNDMLHARVFSPVGDVFG